MCIHDLTSGRIDEQGVAAVAHPFVAIGWNVEPELRIVVEPIVVNPEDRRQIFAVSPLAVIPTRWTVVEAEMEHVGGVAEAVTWPEAVARMKAARMTAGMPAREAARMPTRVSAGETARMPTGEAARMPTGVPAAASATWMAMRVTSGRRGWGACKSG